MWSQTSSISKPEKCVDLPYLTPHLRLTESNALGMESVISSLWQTSPPGHSNTLSNSRRTTCLLYVCLLIYHKMWKIHIYTVKKKIINRILSYIESGDPKVELPCPAPPATRAEPKMKKDFLFLPGKSSASERLSQLT